MLLREALTRILADYPTAKTAPLENHPLAIFIRGEAETAMQEGLGSLAPGLLVQGSPGQGNWAVVPWIAVFDPAITTSATTGYYVVYLFHASEPIVRRAHARNLARSRRFDAQEGQRIFVIVDGH